MAKRTRSSDRGQLFESTAPERNCVIFVEYYGFCEQPFGFTPNPRFLFRSESCREAHASLHYAIANNVGFSALVADPGMGKTTLLFCLLERLRDSARTAFVFNTQDSSRDLLRYINLEFELPDCAGDPVRFHEQFKDFLIGEARENRPVILLVDEAQNLDEASIEAIRLLSDFETPGQKLLHVLLAGQPQFAEKLSQPRLSQFFQRVAIVSRLTKLTESETIGYIEHHIRMAGYHGPHLFTPDALARIAATSGGIPRQINRTCFNSLSIACALKKETVDLNVLSEVEHDLDLSTIADCSAPADRQLKQTSRLRTHSDANTGEYLAEPNCARAYRTADLSTEASVHGLSSDMQTFPAWQQSGRESIQAPGRSRFVADESAATSSLTPTAPRFLSQKSASTPASTALKIAVAALVVIELAIAILLVVRRASTTAKTDSRSAQTTANEESNVRSTNAKPSDVQSNDPHLPSAQSRTVETAGDRNLKATARPAASGISPSKRRHEPLESALASPTFSALHHVGTPVATAKPVTSLQNDDAPPTIPLTSVQSSRMPPLSALNRKAPVLAPSRRGGGEITGGTPITIVQPRFPENTQPKLPQDTVVMDLIVDETGSVRDVQVVSGNSEFIPAAIKAVRSWKYQPYAIDGQPVEMSTRVTLNFHRNQ